MFFKWIFVFFVIIGTCNCVGMRDEYRDYLQDDVEETDLKWDELMEVMIPASETAEKTLQLSDLAKKFQIEKPQYYQNGIYGKRGHMVLFATRKKNLIHPYQFYWAMVKVLSKKYGCFMKEKVVKKNHTTFRCRDGRSVLFTSYEGTKWRLFSGRQFNRNGEEIIMSRKNNLMAKLGFGE